MTTQHSLRTGKEEKRIQLQHNNPSETCAQILSIMVAARAYTRQGKNSQLAKYAFISIPSEISSLCLSLKLCSRMKIPFLTSYIQVLKISPCTPSNLPLTTDESILHPSSRIEVIRHNIQQGKPISNRPDPHILGLDSMIPHLNQTHIQHKFLWSFSNLQLFFSSQHNHGSSISFPSLTLC